MNGLPSGLLTVRPYFSGKHGVTPTPAGATPPQTKTSDIHHLHVALHLSEEWKKYIITFVMFTYIYIYVQVVGIIHIIWVYEYVFTWYKKWWYILPTGWLHTTCHLLNRTWNICWFWCGKGDTDSVHGKWGRKTTQDPGVTSRYMYSMWLILLMEEILHQLIGSLSHYLQRFDRSQLVQDLKERNQPRKVSNTKKTRPKDIKQNNPKPETQMLNSISSTCSSFRKRSNLIWFKNDLRKTIYKQPMVTLSEINIALNNGWLEGYFPFGMTCFQGLS